MNSIPEQTRSGSHATPLAMNDHPRTVRHVSGTSLIAALVLLSVLAACGADPAGSTSAGEVSEPARWISGWLRPEGTFRAEVPSIQHIKTETWRSKFQLERGESGSLVMRFHTDDWTLGDATWKGPTRSEPDRDMDVFEFTDAICLEYEGNRWPSLSQDDEGDLVPSGLSPALVRVRMSTLDWESDQPVSFEVEVDLLACDSEARDLDENSYKTSGTAPPYSSTDPRAGRWPYLHMPETEGLQSLSTWTRDVQSYGLHFRDIHIQVDPEFRCDQPSWMESPAGELGQPSADPVGSFDRPLQRITLSNGDPTSTSLLFTTVEDHGFTLEPRKTANLRDDDEPTQYLDQELIGRVLMNTEYWGQVDEVHLEFQLVCGPPHAPYIVRGAAVVDTKD